MKDGRTERTKDGGKKGKNKGRRKGEGIQQGRYSTVKFS